MNCRAIAKSNWLDSVEPQVWRSGPKVSCLRVTFVAKYRWNQGSGAPLIPSLVIDPHEERGHLCPPSRATGLQQLRQPRMRLVLPIFGSSCERLIILQRSRQRLVGNGEAGKPSRVQPPGSSRALASGYGKPTACRAGRSQFAKLPRSRQICPLSTRQLGLSRHRPTAPKPLCASTQL